MNTNSGQKILIVEDEMIIAADISMNLTKFGYQVLGIKTKGEDAVSSIENNRPDLILMDIMLAGEMDGIETAQQILTTSKVPVIFLTSNSDDATFQRAIQAKPYAFISKPFQGEALSRTLKIAFQHT